MFFSNERERASAVDGGRTVLWVESKEIDSDRREYLTI